MLDVQSILSSKFNGSPVSEVNLTHWRQGGYLQWLTERECFDAARALAEGDGDLASTGLSAERLLNVLTVRFGQLLTRWDTSTDGNSAELIFAQIARKARILQGISRSVLTIHQIQSQSALKKSAPQTSSASSSEIPQQDAAPSRAESAKRADGPGRAAAAQRAGGASEGKTPRNGTMFSPAGQPVNPNILSGPITAANPSHTPFNSGHDLEEILHAISA